MNAVKCICGVEPFVTGFSDAGKTYHYVTCNCHACTPRLPSREKAVEVWNAMQSESVADRSEVKIGPCACGKQVYTFSCSPGIQPPFWVRCEKCGSESPKIESYKDAIRAWNAMQKAARTEEGK